MGETSFPVVDALLQTAVSENSDAVRARTVGCQNGRVPDGFVPSLTRACVLEPSFKKKGFAAVMVVTWRTDRDFLGTN